MLDYMYSQRNEKIIFTRPELEEGKKGDRGDFNEMSGYR